MEDMFTLRQNGNKFIKLKKNGSNISEVVEAVVSVLQEGKIVALPSDTVYGVAALAQDTDAVNSLYRLKKRDTLKPIAICVPHLKDIYRWGEVDFPEGILHDLLPGPVTLVLPRTPILNSALNPVTNNVGVRIPDCALVRAVAAAFPSSPLALTSANQSAANSTVHPQEFQVLWPSLDLVVDGGHLGESRLGSTVIDLCIPGFYQVIRDGCALKKTVGVLQKYGLKERG